MLLQAARRRHAKTSNKQNIAKAIRHHGFSVVFSKTTPVMQALEISVLGIVSWVLKFCWIMLDHWTWWIDTNFPGIVDACNIQNRPPGSHRARVAQSEHCHCTLTSSLEQVLSLSGSQVSHVQFLWGLQWFSWNGHWSLKGNNSLKPLSP